MAQGPRYKVPFRRRREGRTDYRYRARLLRARVPRAVVRLSNKHASIQFIEYNAEGDRVLVSVHSKDLKDYGWETSTNNIPSAYLTGFLAGKRALQKGIEKAVLDIGLKVPAKGATCFAALKGMVDAGMHIPHGEEVIPDEDRLKGAHISEELKNQVEKIKEEMEGE
jgi:large subunit ribosomal protein L18